MGAKDRISDLKPPSQVTPPPPSVVPLPICDGEAEGRAGASLSGSGEETAGASLPPAPGAGRLFLPSLVSRKRPVFVKSRRVLFLRLGGSQILLAKDRWQTPRTSKGPRVTRSKPPRASLELRTIAVPALRLTRAQTFPDDFAPAARLRGKPLRRLPAFVGRSSRLGQTRQLAPV